MNRTSRLLIASGLLIVSVLIARQARFALAPSGAVDAISVITRYDGAFAEEVERTLSVPIEDALASLPQVIAVSSTSSRERSTVVARLAPRSDATRVATSASAAVERLSAGFPLAVSRPQVFLVDPNQRSAFIVAFPRDRGLDRTELEQRFGRIDGVGRVQVVGAPGRDIVVELRSGAREVPGASLAEVRAAIDTRNRVVGLGAARARPIVLDGRTRSVVEVAAVPLADGALVRDRAQVSGAARPVDSITTVSGAARTLVYVNAAANADLLSLSNAVRAEAATVGEALILRDLGAATRRALLLVAAGAGGVVVLALVFLAFWNRSAAIELTGFVILAAPICAATLTAFDRALDTSAIAAFAAAVVLVVVSYARRSLRVAAVAAAAGSLPLLIGGDVVAGIAPALAILVVTPLAAFGYHCTTGRSSDTRNSIAESWSVRVVAFAAAAAGVVLALGLTFATRYQLGEWPLAQQNDVALSIEFPDGTTVTDVHTVAADAVAALQTDPSVAWTAVDARAGRADINIGMRRGSTSRGSQASEMWRDALAEALESVTGGSDAQAFASAESGPRLVVWQWGRDHQEIRARARAAAQVLGSVQGVRGITLGFKQERPELLLSLDPTRTALAGTSPRAVIDELRWDISTPVGVKLLSGVPLDLRLRGRAEIETIAELQTYRSLRSGLDLIDVAVQTSRQTPGTIQRELRARAVPVFLDIDPGTERAVERALVTARAAQAPRAGYSLGLGREPAQRLANRRRLWIHVAAGWLLCALATIALAPSQPARAGLAAWFGAASSAALLAIVAVIGGTVGPFALLAGLSVAPLITALTA